MNAKVLIIEADRLNRKLLADLLQIQRCRTVQASNGDQAEDLVRHHKPDLILLDARLPGRSGLDIARDLKANPDMCQIPVVLTSALDSDNLQKVHKETGCNGYLAKPLSIDQVFKTLRQFIPQPQTATG